MKPDYQCADKYSAVLVTYVFHRTVLFLKHFNRILVLFVRFVERANFYTTVTSQSRFASQWIWRDRGPPKLKMDQCQPWRKVLRKS